jgi:hypothetical protein
MSINILTFICGVGVGLCAAFILITLVNVRRRRFFGVRAFGSTQADFEAALRGKRNDEPTELDQ